MEGKYDDGVKYNFKSYPIPINPNVGLPRGHIKFKSRFFNSKEGVSKLDIEEAWGSVEHFRRVHWAP